MIFSDIQPTGAGLLAVKRKIQIAERGHRVLKLKRDVLILELIRVAKETHQLRSSLEDHSLRAQNTLAIAQMMEGTFGLTIVAISVEGIPQIRAGSRNVMGMRLPVYAASGVKKDLATRGYGLIGTSSVVDEAAEEYEALTDTVIRYAEQVAAIQVLTSEIIRLKRRVNALEFRVLPELYEVRDMIILRKDELEREGLSRIFWVKNRKGSYR
jgi:V/A-type H+/Na+-transporting ATPase subunit D